MPANKIVAYEQHITINLSWHNSFDRSKDWMPANKESFFMQGERYRVEMVDMVITCL